MKKITSFILLFLFIFLSSCIERFIIIKSDPPGAKVWINGKIIGKTPLRYDFYFYGTNEIILYKENCYILHKKEKIIAPLYDTFPFDFIFEFLYPFKIENKYEFNYILKPYYKLDNKEKEKILKRALFLKKGK